MYFKVISLFKKVYSIEANFYNKECILPIDGFVLHSVAHEGMLRMGADNGLNLDTIALCYGTCVG